MRSRRVASNTVSFFAFQDIITSVVGIFVLITLIMMLELVQSRIGAANQRVTLPTDTVQQLQELEQEVASLSNLHASLQANAHKAAQRNAYTVEEEVSTLSRQQSEVEDQLTTANSRTSRLKKQLDDARQNEKLLITKEKELAKKQAESKSLAAEQQETAKAGAILEIEKPLIFRDQTEQGRYLVLVILEKKTIALSDAQNGKSQNFTGSSREQGFNTWLKVLDVKTRQFLLIVKPSGEPDFENVCESLKSRNAVYGFDVASEEQKFRLRSQLGGL